MKEHIILQKDEDNMKTTIKKAAYSKMSTKGAASSHAVKSKKTAPASKDIPKSAPGNGLKKQYLKSNPVCKVTFRLPKDAAPNAGMVTIVGDFNDWNLTETPMSKLKNGDFKATLELACNREYKFRYLIDSKHWENDWCADKYIPNEHGTDDSVVVV